MDASAIFLVGNELNLRHYKSLILHCWSSAARLQQARNALRYMMIRRFESDVLSILLENEAAFEDREDAEQQSIEDICDLLTDNGEEFLLWVTQESRLRDNLKHTWLLVYDCAVAEAISEWSQDSEDDDEEWLPGMD